MQRHVCSEISSYAVMGKIMSYVSGRDTVFGGVNYLIIMLRPFPCVTTVHMHACEIRAPGPSNLGGSGGMLTRRNNYKYNRNNKVGRAAFVITRWRDVRSEVDSHCGANVRATREV